MNSNILLGIREMGLMIVKSIENKNYEINSANYQDLDNFKDLLINEEMETEYKDYQEEYYDINRILNKNNVELDRCHSEINSMKSRMDAMSKHVENLTKKLLDMEENNKQKKKLKMKIRC